MQGVHHVLSRDKELVCPIKAHHQSSQKKKKRKCRNQISKFLSPALTQDIKTSRPQQKYKEMWKKLLEFFCIGINNQNPK